MNPEDQEWEPPSEADMKLIAARRERSDQISKLMSGYLLKGYKMLGSTCAKCDTILLQDRQGTNYCVACSELDSDTNKDDPAINESAAISMARELEMASVAASLPPSGSHLMSGTGFSLQASDATEADVQQFSGQVLTSGSSNIFSLQDQSRIESKPKVSRPDITPSLSISSIDVQSFTTNITSSVKDQTYPRYTSASSKPVAEVGADSGVYSALAEDKKSLGSGDFVLSDSDSVRVSRLQDKINWASQELQNTHSVEYSIHLCQLIKIAAEAMVALRNARM